MNAPRQAARSPSAITNGHVVVEIEGGRVVEVHRLTKTVDIRTEEELKV